MNTDRTDVLTGRIIQRVISSRDIEVSKSQRVVLTHGVANFHDIGQLMKNLFEYFPNSLITLKKLKFGYELRIEVEL